MTERSVFDNSFLSLVERWLTETGEIYVVIRYSHSAGAKDYLLIHTFLELQEKLRSLPAKTEVIVFRRRQLPIRGIADEKLLHLALSEISEGVEWTMEEYDANAQTISRCLEGGTERRELIESFEEYKGVSVAVGKTPTFWDDDDEDMQSALVPLQDGSLVRGVY